MVETSPSSEIDPERRFLMWCRLLRRPALRTAEYGGLTVREVMATCSKRPRGTQEIPLSDGSRTRTLGMASKRKTVVVRRGMQK